MSRHRILILNILVTTLCMFVYDDLGQRLFATGCYIFGGITWVIDYILNEE